jgi:hypothetical protein
MKIDTTHLIQLAKEKIYTQLTAPDHTDEETGMVTPSIHARDLASICNVIISLSKHEEELKSKQGDTSNVVAFPALPPIIQSSK